jgi:hypothetical protein
MVLLSEGTAGQSVLLHPQRDAWLALRRTHEHRDGNFWRHLEVHKVGVLAGQLGRIRYVNADLEDVARQTRYLFYDSGDTARVESIHKDGYGLLHYRKRTNIEEQPDAGGEDRDES